MEKMVEEMATKMKSMEENAKKQDTELKAMKEKVKKLEAERSDDRLRMRIMEAEMKEHKEQYDQLRSELVELGEKPNQASMDTAAVTKVVQEEVKKESETWAKVTGKNATPGQVVTIRDVTDLQDRRSNIIFRGIKESEAEDPKQRKEEDLKNINKVVEAAGMDSESFTEALVHHRRIGQKQDGVNYRPILVKVSSQDFRGEVLRGSRHRELKAYNRANDTRYRLDPDLTKEQKKHLDEMHEEARRKSKNGVRFYVIGKERPVLRSREMTPEEVEAANQAKE